MGDKFNTVVVLDLDDTLYKEIDYQNSGIDAVLLYLEGVYGKSAMVDFNRLELSIGGDWLNQICIRLNLPLSTKESLLWIYRLHRPTISLTLDVKKLLSELRKKSHLAILTDGRSITQRQKINALGLNFLPVYISEEYGSKKPSSLRFEIIMRELPAERYFYVGDNLLKDFIAPNNLGWTSFCLRDDGNNIHSQKVSGLSASQLPKIWLDNLMGLLLYV
jgi:putative hydrolase of the HAD superfamily